MKKLILILGLYASYSIAQEVTILDSPLGRQELISSLQNDTANPFLKQVKYFTFQTTVVDCAPTTISIALNTLGIKYTPTKKYEAPIFTQENIFTQNVINETGISNDTVNSQPGLSLDQTASVLNAYNNIQAKEYYADKIAKDKAKEIILQSLNKSNNVVIVNFLRDKMGEIGGGHFSTIAAYNKDHDSFLVMDVTAHKKWGPTWVPYDLLFNGMNTSAGTNSRGFIIVTKS